MRGSFFPRDSVTSSAYNKDLPAVNVIFSSHIIPNLSRCCCCRRARPAANQLHGPLISHEHAQCLLFTFAKERTTTVVVGVEVVLCGLLISRAHLTLSRCEKWPPHTIDKQGFKCREPSHHQVENGNSVSGGIKVSVWSRCVCVRC